MFYVIRRDNADMSNDKQCEKHCRRKSKVFEARIIRLLSKPAPKVKSENFYRWESIFEYI